MLTSLLLLFATLGTALLLLWLLAVRTTAQMLLSPPRMTDGKAAYRLRRVSPADVGLAFSDIEFFPPVSGPQTPDDQKSGNHRSSRTAVGRIAAWWVPAEGSHKTAILVHGHADAKVGALAWAKPFRDLGYHLLLPDLRAHGESFGKYTTAGVREADDLEFLLDELRRTKPGQCREVVVFGASLGSAAAGLLATRDVGLRAVILDSPVASFEDGALAHARLLSLPGKTVVKPALWLGERWTGVRFEAASLTHTLPRLQCPALMILPTDDAFIGEPHRQSLLRAFSSHRARFPNAACWEPRTSHLLAVVSNTRDYQQQLADFLPPLDNPG